MSNDVNMINTFNHAIKYKVSNIIFPLNYEELINILAIYKKQNKLFIFVKQINDDNIYFYKYNDAYYIISCNKITNQVNGYNIINFTNKDFCKVQTLNTI